MFFSPGGASPILIYALAFWLSARRFRLLTTSADGAAATLMGSVGIGAAMGLLLWGHYTAAFQVLVPSLAIAIVSAGVLIGGLAGGRMLLMPAGFLMLLGTPIPTPLLNAILYPIQLWTAEVSVAVVRLLGYAVQQSGDQILTPWATFQVIETCAGLRAVQTLVMTAFVYGELVGLTRGRRVVLMLLAPAVGVVVNLLRVLLLVFNPVPASQPEHSLQGVLMLIAGVFALWGLDEAMDRVVAGRTSENRDFVDHGDPDELGSRLPVRRISGLVIVLLATGAWSLVLEPWHPAGPARSDVHAIPREIGQWRTGQAVLRVDADFLGSVRFSSRTWRRYQQSEESVTLFVGSNDRLKRAGGLVSDKTKTLESGSFVMGERREISGSDGAKVEELLVVGRGGQALLVHHWYENVRGLWTEMLRSAFGLDRSPWRRRAPSKVVRIATPVDRSPEGLGRARRRLESFSRLARVEIDKLNPPD